MPILDYNHHLSTYNTTGHYGKPDADKEGTSGAEGPRTQVDRSGNGTVDIVNKGRSRLEATDAIKGITTKLTGTEGEQATEHNTTPEDTKTSYTDNEENDRQHKSTTGQRDNTPTTAASSQQTRPLQTEIERDDHICTIHHETGDTREELHNIQVHALTKKPEQRQESNNHIASRGRIRRKTYIRQWRGTLWKTQHICTTIMNRPEMGHALHTPALPTHLKAEYRRMQTKLTTTLYISLIQRTVPGSNPRPRKRKAPRIAPRHHRAQNKKKSKTHSNRLSYYRDNNGQLRRRRHRYTGKIPKGRLLGGAPSPATELLPFCYYIARIEELQQEERKDGEAVEGLSANDYKQLDARGRIDAFRRLGLTTQADEDIRRYYETQGQVTTDPIHDTDQDIKHYTMPELIRLKSKLEKKDYKIRAGIKRIRKDMKLQIQRGHANHKDDARHEVILPGMALTSKCHDLSRNLHRTRELLALTEKTMKHRLQRYKSQPRTVFVSGRTVTDTQNPPTHEEPEEQTRATEEWAYIKHPPRCRLHTKPKTIAPTIPNPPPHQTTTTSAD